MITSTSLNHPTMQGKIFAALQRARISSLRGTGGQAYVLNRNGKPIFRVKHVRALDGGGFTFHKNNQDITKQVLTSLRK